MSLQSANNPRGRVRAGQVDEHFVAVLHASSYLAQVLADGQFNLDKTLDKLRDMLRESKHAVRLDEPFLSVVSELLSQVSDVSEALNKKVQAVLDGDLAGLYEAEVRVPQVQDALAARREPVGDSEHCSSFPVGEVSDKTDPTGKEPEEIWKRDLTAQVLYKLGFFDGVRDSQRSQ